MRTPILIINEKNYIEVSGRGALRLASIAEKVAGELGVEIAVAPPPPSLGLVAGSAHIPVLAQHVDSTRTGSSTGAVVPELVKSLGAVGSLVNHSERRVMFEELKLIVKRLREIGLTSVVCVSTPEEVATVTELKPDFVAIEPPELIGSGVAVSKAKPEVVTNSVRAAERVDSKMKVICGAGIVNGEDVAAALKLGSLGVLVASGVVKAPDWLGKIRELAEPLRRQA